MSRKIFSEAPRTGGTGEWTRWPVHLSAGPQFEDTGKRVHFPVAPNESPLVPPVRLGHPFYFVRVGHFPTQMTCWLVRKINMPLVTAGVALVGSFNAFRASSSYFSRFGSKTTVVPAWSVA